MQTENNPSYVFLPDGERISAFGLGTWHMGERADARRAEVEALRTGIELGLNVIDTAEMYASGGAEEVVAEAVRGRRDDVFIVSKVMPQNASRKGTIAACEKSLRRLSTDRIDLYLLHWRGSHPLAETVAALASLRQAGKIRHWGVSNFDVADMEELDAIDSGKACAANQVLYHLGERGIEFDLLPLLQRRSVSVMAYCPLGQGELADHALLAELGRAHGVSAATIAIAFLLTKPGVQPIPKTARAERVRELARAREIVLPPDDLARLDRAFPPPRQKRPLAMT